MLKDIDPQEHEYILAKLGSLNEVPRRDAAGSGPASGLAGPAPALAPLLPISARGLVDNMRKVSFTSRLAHSLVAYAHWDDGIGGENAVELKETLLHAIKVLDALPSEFWTRSMAQSAQLLYNCWNPACSTAASGAPLLHLQIVALCNGRNGSIINGLV